MASSSCGSSSTGSDTGSWSDFGTSEGRVRALWDDDAGQREFGTVEEALSWMKEAKGVDLVRVCEPLDFFQRIRLINYVRSTNPAPSSIAALDVANSPFLQDDKYLQPVLEDDELLQVDFDDLSAASSSSKTQEQDPTDLLRAQIADLQQALAATKKALALRMDASVTSGAAATEEPVAGKSAKGKERDDDSHYFESYEENEIHEIMLKDSIRTTSYQKFIMSNPALFKGKTVMDVGCGTGILSLFAAKAGARRVYAIEASKLAFKAEENVKENGFEGVVKVIKKKAEDVVLDEGDKVDVVISEWMGYFLLYESMLPSVLSAFHRLRAPQGAIMAPSQCTILLSLMDGLSYVQSKVTFWDSVYGMKMSAMKRGIEDEAWVDYIASDEVVSEVVPLQAIHTQECTAASLDFKTTFETRSTKSTKVHAFLGWFDTFFTHDGRLVASRSDLKEDQGEVFFSTGPGAADVQTHWKQTIFLLKEPMEVNEGETVKGDFTVRTEENNSRELVVQMTWKVINANKEEGKLYAQSWKVR